MDLQLRYFGLCGSSLILKFFQENYQILYLKCLWQKMLFLTFYVKTHLTALFLRLSVLNIKWGYLQGDFGASISKPKLSSPPGCLWISIPRSRSRLDSRRRSPPRIEIKLFKLWSILGSRLGEKIHGNLWTP